MHAGEIRRERKRTNAVRCDGRVSATLTFTSLMVLIVPLIAFASDRKSASEGVDFFESKVRPVLVEHCYKCHSSQLRTPKGGLRLDSPDEIRKGGDMGPAVVPGDVSGSLLVEAVRYNDEALRMPPKGKLPDAAIASLEQWVKDGAVAPLAGPRSSSKPIAKQPAGIDFEAARRHWSYQPVRKPRCPRFAIETGRSRESTPLSWHGWKRTG